MKFILRSLLLPLIFCVAAFPAEMFAQNTLFVDNGGNNNNPVGNNCQDPAFKCQTIEYALTKATADDIIIASGNLLAEPMPLIITKPITLRGSQSGIRPVLDGTFAPVNRGTETRLTFDGPEEHILIQNGVNNVTIEGFEFYNNEDDDLSLSPQVANVLFTNGAAGNSNITIRRNIQEGGGTRRRRFLLKENTGGNLTNINIVENRILGLGGNFGVTAGISSGVAAIEIQKAASGEIRSNIISTSYNQPNNRVQKGIQLSNVTNFTVAQNEFRGTVSSAIEILGTNTTGLVLVELNTFIDCNTGNFINESGGGSPLAAGILLWADGVNSSSLIIRNNDFQGNNRFAVAVPSAHNNFTTNAIQIQENKFSITNAGGNNANADLYVGNNATNPAGTIYANGNWWGHLTYLTGAPSKVAATTGASPGGSVSSDILGGTARNKVNTSFWLINNTDANGAATPGFVSDKIVTHGGSPAGLQAAFSTIFENWTLRVQDATYGGTLVINGNAFTLDPTTVAAPGVKFSDLTLNAANKIITVAKSFTVSDGSGSGNLTLTNGKFLLNGSNINVPDASSILGGNADSYIITNGTGRLYQNEIGSTGFKSGTVNFPVGPDDDFYTPVTITNSGDADNFGVRVREGISPNGNTGVPVTTNAVDLTWDISEESAGGSNASVSLQWNIDLFSPETDNEQDGFDRTKSYVSHYNTTTSLWESFEAPKPAAAGTITNSWKQTVAGISSFSPFTVGDRNAPLPVDFVFFNAALQEQEVQLAWKTSSETNNAFFVVERSVDGITFGSIGEVTGNGTSNQSHQYYFTDTEAVNTGSDVLYYRLKQVDTDETFAYSKVASVNMNSFVIGLSPNPASERITVRVPQPVQLDVVNSQGQTVRQQEIKQQALINIATLPQGIYIFRFFDGKKMHYRKVAVQK